MPVDRFEILERFLHLPPHNAFLGMRLCSIEKGITTELPIRPALVSDADTGILHGGVIAALLDATCTIAVMSELEKFCRIATLDLRIDYLKPCAAKKTIKSHSCCIKLTQQVAFVEGTAYVEDAQGHIDNIAKATATFMLLRPRTGVQQ